MTMLTRIASAVLGRETRADPPPPTNAEALAPYLGNFGSGGRYVSAHTAENLSAVLGAVGAISTALSSLPAIVYRQEGADRIEAPAHPLARLIAAGPNAWQDWPDFIEWTAAQALLHGNALAEIVTDGRGAVAQLAPIPWGNVSVQMLQNGRLVYDVVAYQGPFGGTGRMRRLLDSEVVHIRDRSDDGLIGRSRLSRARATFSTALAAHEYAAATYENKAAPSGALMVKGKANADALKRLREQFEAAFAGPSRAARALVLDQETSWSQFQIMSPEDAELLASRKFSTEEIARIFNVPPPIIQDYSHNTFTNSQAAGRWFAQFTLLPWVKKLEAGFRRALLGQGYSISLDLSEFMRGDDTARWAAHKIAVDAGILDTDEIREIEGWNPRGGRAAA